MNAGKLDKQVRFERLAEKRVTEVVKRLRLIGNLANRHNYSYTDDHVRQILTALEQELRLLKARFQEEQQSDSPAFRFHERDAKRD